MLNILLTCGEVLLGLFLYVFVGTLMTKLAKKLDFPEPSDFFAGVLWPAVIPLTVFVFLVIGMTTVAADVADRVTAGITSMWEEWRA